jgi:hypothetical protein
MSQVNRVGIEVACASQSRDLCMKVHLGREHPAVEQRSGDRPVAIKRCGPRIIEEALCDYVVADGLQVLPCEGDHLAV